MNTLKTTTRDDVKRVALELIDKNGNTSTLDVKLQLRKEGYYATQNLISGFMTDIINEVGLDASNNGRYRTISHSNVSAVNTAIDSNDDDNDDTVQTTDYKSGKRYIRRDGVELVSLSQPAPGDWVLSDARGLSESLVFDGRFTRDQVRQAYANINGMLFTDTRSERSK